MKINSFESTTPVDELVEESKFITIPPFDSSPKLLGSKLPPKPKLPLPSSKNIKYF